MSLNTVSNVLLVCIDTLRRDMLGCYRDEPRGFGYPVETDSLERFAEKATIFDGHYAGSLPTIPARREILTGRQGLLWRGWGPMEPWDEQLPAVLRNEDVVSQLITDNIHYFNTGSGSRGYYETYNGVEFVRGHARDAWRTDPRHTDEDFRRQLNAGGDDDIGFMGFGIPNRSQYARNVAHLDGEEAFFAPQVFQKGARWLEANQAWEQWFCFLDSFDVHEPFHCPEPYASMYTEEDPSNPELPHWHQYGPAEEFSQREIDFLRALYAGKTTMLDRWFGRVLDTLDATDAWDDTMVIVTADHGHFLGDHDYVGKNDPPEYDVVARLPLLIFHPDASEDRIEDVTATVDLHDTIIEAYGCETGLGAHSFSLLPLLEGNEIDREVALYGQFKKSINVADGRYTYHRPTDPNGPVARYSTALVSPDGEETSLPWTEYPVWRSESTSSPNLEDPMLFDTDEDPAQESNRLEDQPEVRDRLVGALETELDRLGSPPEHYERFGLVNGIQHS